MAESEKINKTLEGLMQKSSAAYHSEWCCRNCGAKQKPPPTDEMICQPCARKAIETAKQARAAAIEGLVRAYGVPPALGRWNSPLSGMEWLLGYAKPGARGLYLWGEAGVGKSVAAVQVLRQWLREWAEVDLQVAPAAKGEWHYVGCADLVMRLQDTWRSENDSAYKLLRSLAAVPRLIIDDLGTEKPTEYVKQSIYFLINEREQWLRQTIITSNWSVEDLNGQYDIRISSRIVGMCDVREISGRDRRKR